jgi:cell division transport system permease protein
MIKRYFALHWSNCIGALRRMARQPVGSLLTVMVIAIALALPAALRVLVNNADLLSDSWEGAADFTVYLGMDVGDEQAKALADDVRKRDDVAEVTLISRAQALEEFRARSGFGEALDALEENPLPHTLVVRPAGGAAGDIEQLARALEERAETDLVQVDTQWVARLRGMLKLIARVIDIVTVLVGLAVALVIGNTIRLEINNRSTEIEVMKLVGGTDGFIRRPFLYLGIWYGAIGALAAAVLLFVALSLLRNPVAALAGLYASGYELAGLDPRETLTLVAGGAALGWAGAWLAAFRHLKAIEPK